MIGIIGAMDIEIEELKYKIKNIETINIFGIKFYKGMIYEQEIILTKSGIGKVNATIAATILIDRFKVNLIINIGVAGALSNNLKIYDAVISTKFIHHDIDSFSEKGRRIFDANEKLIEISKKAAYAMCKENNISIFEGIIASGDRFLDDKNEKNDIKNKWDAIAVEMEGASIAQVCNASNIAFIGIRSISDSADSNATVDFADFAKKAAKNSTKIIFNILKDLKNYEI